MTTFNEPTKPKTPIPLDYRAQPSDSTPYHQESRLNSLRTTRNDWQPEKGVYASREHEPRPVPRAAPGEESVQYPPLPQADHSQSPSMVATTQWASYDSLESVNDRTHRVENKGRSRQDLDRAAFRQDQVDSHQSKHQTITFPGSCGLPHLPGVTQYLELREHRNGLHANPARSFVGTPSASEAQVYNTERTQLIRPDTGLSTSVLPSKRLSPTKSLDVEATSKRHIRTPSMAYGTQHVPLEILSSPEPEVKRRKPTNHEQSPVSQHRQAPKSKGSPSIDELSKQQVAKLRPEPTNVNPRKPRFYAVAVGRRIGIYTDWPSTEEQVNGFFGAKHKKFKTEEEALAFIEKHREDAPISSPPAGTSGSTPPPSFDSEIHVQSTNYGSIRFDQLSRQQAEPLNRNHSAVAWNNDALPVIDDGPKLVPEQQHVVDLIIQGHNVFYTGSAGCGKSTILKTFVRQLQQMGKRVKIVAPTNLAALNVGGQTTWNFAGWTPDSMKVRIDKLMENSRGKESWKKFDETDVLVIDEISMIENLQFERLNMILKASRGEKYGGGAFGGVQLIVTGDFYQLSPVKPFARCMCGWELERDNKNNPKEYACTNKDCREHTFYDIDKWAFRSHAWEECDFKHVNLTQIHRQSDMMFKSILNRIRTDGTILKPHANVLLNHTSETEGAIEIYARRFDVDRVNNENIAKIQSAARAYKCLDDVHWPDHHRSDRTLERNTYRLPDGSLSALKEHRFETQVQLKLNQRVVLQANLDPNAGLVNGAQGIIVEFKEYDKKALPRAPEKKGAEGDLRGDHAAYRQAQIELFSDANGHQPWPVVQFTNGVIRTIFADCTVNILGNEEPWCKLSRTQIPLAAGYAITVHKSQGMTLDRVTVDLARAFEPSQIYVALSRARSLKGLTVTALPRFDLGGANAQVKEFMENVVIKKKTNLQIAG